jgi:ABC-2 type transport system permease protein
MVAGLLGLIIDLFLIWLNHARLLASNKLFLKEIEIEDKERLKYIKIILNFSMAVEKENRIRGKKPYFLFRNSKRLFKNRNKLNGLTEILIKSFLRNRRNLTSYFQILLVTTSAIIVLPVWIKWLVFFGFAIFINFWLSALFKKMLMSDFFAVVFFEMDTSNLAGARCSRLLSFPFIFLIGTILIVRMIY